MSLSDCPICWNTPCSCGHEYKNYSKEKVIELVHAAVLNQSKEDVRDIFETVAKRMGDINLCDDIYL